METIIIIILVFTTIVWMVRYFRLRVDYKDLVRENVRLYAQLDQLSKNYKKLLIEYNRYHRKRGADGRFVKKGGINE